MPKVFRMPYPTACPTFFLSSSAVIVECAFVDNPTDLKILASEGGRQKVGYAIGYGILKTLGIRIQAETSTIYRVQVGAYSIRENAEAMQKKLKEAGFDAYITK